MYGFVTMAFHFFVKIVWHFSTVIPKPIRRVCTRKHIRFFRKYLSSLRPGPWFEPRLSTFLLLLLLARWCCSVPLLILISVLLLLFGYSCHKNKNKITSVHAWLVIVSQKEKEKKRNETKRNETKRNTNFSADLVGRGTTTAATATVAPGLLRRRHAPLQA